MDFLYHIFKVGDDIVMFVYKTIQRQVVIIFEDFIVDFFEAFAIYLLIFCLIFYSKYIALMSCLVSLKKLFLLSMRHLEVNG